MVSRRYHKTGWFLYCVAIFIARQPAAATAQTHMPLNLPHDGNIRFYISHLDEFAEVEYLKDGKWLPRASEIINGLFRSRDDGQESAIDARLIELADHLQDHFGADTIEIISGYRSPAFNKALKDTGHHVAGESYHTKGLACDIHIDEIPEDRIRDYLRALQLGGVGYYGNLLMVHMDFGPVRFWHAADFSEKTNIGLFNKDNDRLIRTDRLNYRPHGLMQLSVSGGDKSQRGVTTLEKFHRGAWRVATTVVAGDWQDGRLALQLPLSRISGMSIYGKYRLRYQVGLTWQNSNEFYVKKTMP